MNTPIRNVAIIAHVDHGKSTLADRILEYTGVISEREMGEQMLDRMELERERGITIKMQPAMVPFSSDGVSYAITFIDTPGHIDFSYEVSRSLRAVEGVILLVDATQGVQAQTLSVFHLAKKLNLTVVPVLSKVDVAHAQIEETTQELVALLGCQKDTILHTSGKTGLGVPELLKRVVDVVPAPEISQGEKKALIFDFSYDTHHGIKAYVRVFSGTFSKGQSLSLLSVGKTFQAKEVGIFTPEYSPQETLSSGTIGYVTTGIKEPGVAVVGDTLASPKEGVIPFPGYQTVQPVIWASIYPHDASHHTILTQALEKLRLSDAALQFEQEHSKVLGKGFRCGFLGLLHLEIISERLKREVGVALMLTTPSTDYEVTTKNGTKEVIVSPSLFPDRNLITAVSEPWVELSIIVPIQYLAAVSKLLQEYEGSIITIVNVQENRSVVTSEMPLRELMRHFFDRLKSVSAGYASLSYTRLASRPGDVVRMDVLLSGEVFPAFSKIIARSQAKLQARRIVKHLRELLPRALFTIKIQAVVDGTIIASETLSALRKDVTAKLYGGDVTRKMKLLEKQKKGKEKRQGTSQVRVPHDVFLKVMQRDV